MVVAPVSVRQVFDPGNPGFIDNTGFELAADGKALAYITVDEDGGSSWLTRLRLLNDIDTCVGCNYQVGLLLAEHVGLYHVLGAPRFGIDGSRLWLEDRRGDYYHPYLSAVPVAPPGAGLHAPAIVVDGGALSTELQLLGLRSSGSTELLAYSSKTGSGCAELVVADTAACSNGTCARVNSATPRILMHPAAGSLQAANGSTLEVVLQGANESRNGRCSITTEDQTYRGYRIVGPVVRHSRRRHACIQVRVSRRSRMPCF